MDPDVNLSDGDQQTVAQILGLVDRWQDSAGACRLDLEVLALQMDIQQAFHVWLAIVWDQWHQHEPRVSLVPDSLLAPSPCGWPLLSGPARGVLDL